MYFFVWQYILAWIKGNALQSLGEFISLLWLIETVNYLLLLLLSEWTVFGIAGNMCSKDLDKEYTLDIVFLYCIVLYFNVSFANALHFFSLVFHCHAILIENVCRLLCKSTLPTMFIKICVRLKHIHLASYVEVEKLLGFRLRKKYWTL